MRGCSLCSPPWPAQLPRPQQPDAGRSVDRHHDAEVRHLHQSEWCRSHLVVGPRRLVAPGVEDQQQPGRSGRLQQDPARAIRDTTRVAAARCCGWQRSLPIGILHRQLLGIGVRPGRCPGPADRPDLVLGGMLGVVPGLLPDHAGVQHPPRRRGGRGHRSCTPALTRPTCSGAGVTGGFQSPPAASAQLPARGVPTTRRLDLATSGPPGVATSRRSRLDQARRPGGPRSPTRPVGGGGSP
jgi:hypothetical protein